MILRLGANTLHVLTADETLHWALDREGRLLAGHERGDHHRVALDYSLLSCAPQPATAPRRLPIPEGDQLLSRTAAALREARALLASGHARLEHGPGTDADAGRATSLALLDRAAARAAAPELERVAFGRVYGPVRMVPPDCSQAVVLQLTEGCSWGRCSFCALYAGVPFRRKEGAGLTTHLDGVASLLGAGAALRMRLFIGDANALLAPMASLLATLAGGRARFPEAARAGADCFVDAFSGRGRTEHELRVLRRSGLRRITVGLESGCERLLRRLGKPTTPAGVGELVRRARRAGLRLGVTVLAGVGGPDLAEAHVADTLGVVRGLGLGSDDLVFVSPLVGQPGGPPQSDTSEVDRQAACLREGLAGGPWRVARYDIRRAIY